MTNFVTLWCPLCGGVSHPATGCVYTPTFVVCGPCTRRVGPWIEAWTAGKGSRRKASFYGSVGALGASVRLPPPPMSSALLHDLANVAQRDADAIADQYAWPPRPPLTPDERRERDRLDAMARAIRYRAHCAEYDEQPTHQEESASTITHE